MKAILSHIAVLVRSAERAAEPFRTLGHPVGPAEDWDGEGTREIYVGGADHSARLLLMEPVKPGAYTRALEKRGPGLHHLGIDVLDAEGYAMELGRAGWMLHPRSLETFRRTKTLWLARPGIGTLLEVQAREALAGQKPFVGRVRIAAPASRIAALGLAAVTAGGSLRIILASGETPALVFE